jgi:hypothetical protein
LDLDRRVILIDLDDRELAPGFEVFVPGLDDRFGVSAHTAVVSTRDDECSARA